MKKPKFFGFKIKKFNYDIDKIIGIDANNDKFILDKKQKIIKRYNERLKSNALLSTYIPIEEVIFYTFETEKNILSKINIDDFVEVKVYEEAGIEESEKYFIKYKINSKNEKTVKIETIIVSYSFIENGYEKIINETGYIDYISFPAFSYEILYEEKIIQKANDLFVVFLEDKIFLTFYSEGELLNVLIVSGGLDKIYESLNSEEISDINEFKELLIKKGINDSKYENDKTVCETIKKRFLSLADIINAQIEKTVLKYNLNGIDRIYITSEYGNIEGLDDYMRKTLKTDTFEFNFYQEYYFDKLLNPFLMFCMFEAHYAYKHMRQIYNYSIKLRKPRLFYRRSGKLLLTFISCVVVMGIYPFYLYFQGISYEKKNKYLQSKIDKAVLMNTKLTEKANELQKQLKIIKKECEKYKKNITNIKRLIKAVYDFKYSYIPKSSELVDIVLIMRENEIYLDTLKYDEGVFVANVFSFEDNRISNFVDALIKKYFFVESDNIIFNDKKYKTSIRIKE